MKSCKKCKGTGTIYLEGSIHGEDDCPDCSSFVVSPKIMARMPLERKTFTQKSVFEITWEELKRLLNIK